MSEVEQIERRIKNLSPEDLAKLPAWIAEFDAQAWDRQIEADSAARTLDRFIEDSLVEHKGARADPFETLGILAIIGIGGGQH